MKYFFICVISTLTAATLVGCDNGYAKMEGAELRKRAHQCDVEPNSTAAEMQVCKNIKRECLRRHQTGQFDC